MFNIRFEDLVNISNKLINAGYNVRRHCCEYFVGDFEKFICVITVFPRWKEVRVYTLTKDPLPKDIMNILRNLADKYALKLVIKDVKFRS
ncbi:MAG: hypothetical protein ACTSXW_00660 [Candidatus Baldrarchaeia archaeon]